MFVLDTNVLFAMIAPPHFPEVDRWVAQHSRRVLYTTAINQAEVLSGLAIMVEGRRHTGMLEPAARLFEKVFRDRVLVFDSLAAVAFAEAYRSRRTAGLAVKSLDLTIAAITLAHEATIVTLDVPGFTGCGIAIINPWQP